MYLPVALPQRLEELFGIVVQMAAEIRDPFEQAFFLMVHLPYLQPFEDVNKRVSRLAANIPFIRHNLCPLSFIDVPQQAYVDAMIGVYELNRVELGGAKKPPTVTEPDREHFIQLVLEELAALHPGNAVRFGIRPSELAAWREKQVVASD